MSIYSDDALILPEGISPVAKMPSREIVYCQNCGSVIKREHHRIKRTLTKNWKVFCGLECFRTAQTKHVGLSPVERRYAYEQAVKDKRKRKRK